MKIIEFHSDWETNLRREYPGVTFADGEGRPQGINATAAGVLVGRFYSGQTPPYGVIFDQARSCSGKS